MPRFAPGLVNADAQSASLRENHLSRHLRVCPRKAFSPSLGHLAEGRAPHARGIRHGLTEACARYGHRALPCITVVEMECPGLRPALTRTHRVRPSEKTAFRVISGFPRKAFSPSLGHLAEGRAPHARKGGITLNRMSPLFGRPRQSVGEGDMPRLASDPYSRTRRPRPPRKPPSRYLRTFSCKASDRGVGPLPLPITQTKRGIRRSPFFPLPRGLLEGVPQPPEELPGIVTTTCSKPIGLSLRKTHRQICSAGRRRSCGPDPCRRRSRHQSDPGSGWDRSCTLP
jgi:hypothetical protein